MIPAGWTVPVKAGAPPAIHDVKVVRSSAFSSAWCGVVSSAARIGALAAFPLGKVAGAPEGSTQAMTDRNDVTDHPAAGDVAPWQEAQCS